MMAYHAQPEMSLATPLLRAAAYIPLCFGVKSLIMTIDDILDHDVDGLVERTKYRALPRGAISLRRAWLFFALQVVIGVYSAQAFLSPIALRVSMAVWPLYLIYPTCKRWTNYAPIPLGLMFKVGIFMGWADISTDGTVPWSTLIPLYVGGCLWTITYETVYQHQDKADDIRIGLNSLALRMGSSTIPLCTVTAFGFIGLLAYAGFANGNGLAFYLSVATASVLLLNRLWRTDIDVPAQCKDLFLGSPTVGRVVLAGLFVDAIVQRITSGIPL